MAAEKAKKKTRVIAIGAAVLVVLVAIAGFFIVQNGLSHKSYQVSLEEGKKYFADNDFENAVLAYQAAVEADPESEEAVLGLANSYIALKDYSNAKSILRVALNRFDSPEVEMLLTRINFLYYGIGDGSDMTQEEIDEQSRSVSLNKAIWKDFGALTFDTYKKKYPDSRVQKSDAGQPTLVSSSLKRICYFENTDSLEKNGNPKPDAYPTRIELMDLSAVFDHFDTVLSYEKLLQIFSKKVNIKYDELLGCDAVYATYGDNTLVAACDKNGNILSKSALNYVLVGAGSTQKCLFNGKISDAITGKAVKAELTITPLSGSKAEPVKLNTSENSGSYSADLEAGKYKVSVHADGYIDTEADITIDENQKTFKKDFALSPELKDGEIRIVLEWSSSPRDLDCYLFDDQNHRLYFGNKKLSDSKGDIASLDRDCQNGYGPETVTIYRTDRNYRYCVNDFRNESSKSVQNSKATVKVYMPGEDPVTLNVPGGDGNIWEVLEINHGELKIVNEMQNESTSPGSK